jgi:ferredoxin
MHVSANRETCTVSSLCVYRAPEVFDQDDEGQVVLLNAEPPPEQHEGVRDAVRSCPTRSLSIDYEVG